MKTHHHSAHHSPALGQQARLRHLIAQGSLAALLACAAITPAFAKDVETTLQVVSIKSVKRSVPFYVQDIEKDGQEGLLEVKVSTNRMPPPVSYKGGHKIKLLTRPEGGGYQPVASVTLPVSVKQVIIVLFPAPEDAKIPYKAVVLDGSLSSFKPGTRRVVNMSKYALRGEMGANPFTKGDEDNLTFECAPEEVTDVPVLDPDAKPLASQPVILEYQKDEKKWRVLSSTRWFHTPSQRHLVFVYDDKKRKTTVLHGLTESVKSK